MNTRTRIFAIMLAAGAMLGVGAGTASASGLTVTIPCGCKPVVDQPVGDAATTPAVDNPSGSVGNTSGAGQDHSLLIYPSGSASFSAS